MWQSVFRLIIPNYCIDLIDMCSRTSVPRETTAVSWPLIHLSIPAHPVRGAEVLQFQDGMQVAALVQSSYSYTGNNPDAHWRIHIGWVQDSIIHIHRTQLRMLLSSCVFIHEQECPWSALRRTSIWRALLNVCRIYYFRSVINARFEVVRAASVMADSFLW
jgi:hypothetical protein